MSRNLGRGQVRTVDPSELGLKSVVVVSPHLDDAVLSIGATIASLRSSGCSVRVLTVFAGDPSSEGAVQSSDRATGADNQGEAVLCRRREDRLACSRLGAQHDWIDLEGRGQDDLDHARVAEEIAARVPGTELILAPGLPITHPDHRFVAEAVALLQGYNIAYYREQPYASWMALSRDSVRGLLAGEWFPPASAAPDGHVYRRTPVLFKTYVRKLSAMSAYESQLKILRKLPRTRIAAHELLVGGELVAWPPEALRGLRDRGVARGERA